MYQKTDKKYLYYKYESRYYKVPTFGRLVKIIDFGRAIYQFKGNLICSDSFNKNEDAATQDKEPTQTDVKITEFKVENTKWKKGGLADE